MEAQAEPIHGSHGPDAVHAAASAEPYIQRLIAGLRAGLAKTVILEESRSVSAGALLDLILSFANALEGLGIGRGSLIALFAPNRMEALAVRYAANFLGAGACYLSAPAAEADRAKLIVDIDPSLLVVFAETAHLLPAGMAVPVAEVGSDATEAVSMRPQLDQPADRTSGTPRACAARMDDLAVIVSSGGSTGVPKGSWRSFAAYGAMVSAPSPADRRQLVNGPLAYLSQVLVDITLLGGGCVVLRGEYDPAKTLALIEAERITDLFLVEPQLFEMMDHPDVDRRDLSSLRTLTHVGASAPETLRRRARDRLGPVIVHTYGASEEGLVSILSARDHERPGGFGSAGRLLPGVEVRLTRPDGSVARPGEPGAIEVRSPAMAQGYRNRPDLEAAAFVEGWYHSGDLGVVDEEGYLAILGRAAEIEWIDGVMISPTRVEDTLCRCAEIRYAVVVVDQPTGRWITAVVPWPGQKVEASRLRAIVADEHGPTVAARVDVVSFERVPLTKQGKPDRAAIHIAWRHE